MRFSLYLVLLIYRANWNDLPYYSSAAGDVMMS